MDLARQKNLPVTSPRDAIALYPKVMAQAKNEYFGYEVPRFYGYHTWRHGVQFGVVVDAFTGHRKSYRVE